MVTPYERHLARPVTPVARPATVRAAWWAWRSMRHARRDLAEHGLAARVPPPPTLPAGARRGVNAVLRRSEPTCLERCLVQQTWLAAHDVTTVIVVGVPAASDEPAAPDASRAFSAHAWLDVESTAALRQKYREIHRIKGIQPDTA